MKGAPQIGAGRKFFSRPVLRVFLTYARWSDGFRGFVGGIPFEIGRVPSPMACRLKHGGRTGK